MSNMSYCRFQNTAKDLQECADALDEIGGELDSLSREEARAAKSLIWICQQIASNWSEVEE